MGILAELARVDMLDLSVPRADGNTLAEAIAKYDLKAPTVIEDAFRRYKSAPGGGRNLVMGSQENYFKELDTDRADGCIRDYEHAYNKDGGLAVLYGNIARNGCIVKTAGVDPSVYHFKGTAKVFQSQDDAWQRNSWRQSPGLVMWWLFATKGRKVVPNAGNGCIQHRTSNR